jgi:hypothetical protein
MHVLCHVLFHRLASEASDCFVFFIGAFLLSIVAVLILCLVAPLMLRTTTIRI